MKTVLIVDDSEIDRLIHTKILEQIKQVREIHTASNGGEAITLLNEYFQQVKSLPHIILLDLNMPIMDGFAFIESFKKLPLAGKENVIIAIVSSSSSRLDIQKAKEKGIDIYLEKPLSEEKLLNALCGDRQ
jgi:CheY-like chemotaxis protein